LNIKDPDFSIIHTSARPDKWREVYDAWIQATGGYAANVEYVLCVDARWGFREDAQRYWQEWREERFGLNLLAWNEFPYKHSGYVAGVNLAASLSHGKVLVVNADDQFPCEQWHIGKPGNWPQMLAAKMTEERLDGNRDAFVIRASTGTVNEHGRRITVMPILSRKLYKQWGYVFYPEYESMFADNDFYESVQIANVWIIKIHVVDATDLVFPHRHPLIPLEMKYPEGKYPGTQDDFLQEVQGWDDQYKAQQHADNYHAGWAIIQKRRKARFGEIVPCERCRQTKCVCKKSSKRVIAIALPGETYSKEFLGMLIGLYGWLMEHGWAPFVHQAYTAIVYCTRQRLLESIMAQDPKPEFILWLDHDNLLTREQFQMLLADLESRPDLDSVAGWYWCLNPDGSLFTSVGIRDSAGRIGYAGHDIAAETQLLDCAWHGFGAVLMRLSCLEKAGDHPFLPIMMPEANHRMSGEDTSFGINAAKGGAKCVVDPRVQVLHQKRGYIGMDKPAPPLPKIFATIRARNEEQNIERCIRSVGLLCEAVLVLDDHSRDRTPYIARESGAAVINSLFEDRDEGRDRQYLLDLARQGRADWIFAIDADEALDPRDVETLRRACQYTDADALHLRWMNLWNSEKLIRVDGIYGMGSPPRLWRATPSLRLVSMSNGIHTWSEREVKRAGVDVRLWHWGYIDRDQRLARWRNYNAIDPNNYGEDCYRHIVQGDLAEVSADEVRMKAGPLKLEACELPEVLQRAQDNDLVAAPDATRT
jgi:hypothetical protein